MATTAAELNQHLSGFYGSEQYHRDVFCFITDGVKAMMEKAEAGWLVSDIGAVMIAPDTPKVRGHGIVFWTLTVKAGKGTLICQRDSGQPILYQQEYAHTDFPEGTWKFYFNENVVGKLGLLYLPSEY